MKKYLVVFLILLACFTIFTGCEKSNEAKKVEGLIKQIETVNVYSNKKITEAEEALSKLGFIEKLSVSGRGNVKKARKEFSKLVVENAEEKIDNVCKDKVTLDSISDIKKAEEAINKVPEDILKDVSNIDNFEKSKNDFDSLVIKVAEEKIAEIGEVTLEKANVIENARKIVDMLQKAEPDKIKNIGALVEAEKKLVEIKEEERKSKFKEALSRTKSEYDNVNEITRYEPSAMPYYVNTRSYVLPMISNKTLFVRWLYTGDDWIFWDSLTINVDGEKTTKTFGDILSRVERDNGGGDVWEYSHTPIFSKTSDDYKLLEKIGNSKETIIRFKGDSKYYDLYVSNSDKQAIKDMLFIYDNIDLLDN